MEGYGASTYGDRFADVYDDWYADVSNVGATVARVVELARGAGGGPVLELGVGSGRLALPLVEAGLEVWGVDASAAMVDRLRAKPGGDRVHAIVGDMARLDEVLAPEAAGFGVVLCAFNTLFNLTRADDQQACIAAAARRLAPGGALVVEGFVPPPGDEEAAATGAVEPRHIGVDEVVLTVSRHDPADQTIVGQHVQLRESGVRLRPWVLRYATPDQITAWAAGAGLRLASRHGDWRGAPFDARSANHVSVFRR